MSLNVVYKSKDDLKRLTEQFQATETQINKALRTAVNRSTRWVKANGSRGVSHITGVRQKVIRGRVVFKIDFANMKGRVWFGLNSISMGRLSPRQSRTGVTAGPARVSKAFIGRSGSVFKRVGRSRLPIKKQFYDIEKEANAVIEADIVGKLEHKFLDEFERALKWQTGSRN